MTRVVLAALAIMLALGPARAEFNRLLPFWGQPFPAGYVPRTAEPRPVFACAPGRRAVVASAAHGRRVRCETVLHARD